MSPFSRSVLPGLACGTLLLTSCLVKPSIKDLSKPLTATPLAGELLNPTKLSAPSRQALRREGLLRSARRDPSEAIRAIDAGLRERDSADLRVAGAEIAINSGQRLREKDPATALGYYLTAVELTKPSLYWRESEERTALRFVYNQASAELAATYRETHGGSSKMTAARGPLRTYRLSWKKSGQGAADPAFYDTLRPANYLKVKGFDERKIQDGYGGALVGLHAGTPERLAANQFLPRNGWAVPLTALITLPGSDRAHVELRDLTVNDEITYRGKKYPLEADFSAPVATIADASPALKIGFFGLFDPTSAEDSQGLYLIAPYKRDRIPLVLVHGLMSSPVTWKEVINACYGDPFLREHYQLLAYFYPTGYPIAKNAADFRVKMREFQEFYDPRGTNRYMKNIVMVGHSLGGIMTDAQIRSGGDRVWNMMFDKPIDEIEMTDEERATVKELAYYKANPNIKRAVFVCAPHRGSNIANNPIGRIGSWLTKYPIGIIDFTSQSLVGSATGLTRSFLADPTDGIDDLKVGAPVLDSILGQPMTYKQPFHTIVGDRGKGDGPETRSDGVVPYWSAHLDGAQSEVIVPTGHDATNHPETVNEIVRILYLHLGRKYKP